MYCSAAKMDQLDEAVTSKIDYIKGSNDKLIKQFAKLEKQRGSGSGANPPLTKEKTFKKSPKKAASKAANTD